MGNKSKKFGKLHSVGDFQDGFYIAKGRSANVKNVQALLKAHKLECLPLRTTTKPGYYFAQ